MGGHRWMIVAAALPVLAAPSNAASASDRAASVPFLGKELLVPPQQALPWAPPKTTLPAKLIEATKDLYGAGLADPRGCEYREISVSTGNCWSGDSGLAKTRGWVLPAPANEKQRFAVCWNGLVYPVVEVGDKADVRDDVHTTIKTDSRVWLDHAIDEATSIAHDRLLPLRACLLLRFGEGELAEKLWTAWSKRVDERVNNNDVQLKDPYLMLASDWAWSLFDRAICAHMRADDGLALVSARALVPIERAIEKAAAAREYRRPTAMNNKPLPYLTFLEPLPRLLADQERRAQAEKAPEHAGRGARERRIAGLIRDLENVSARQKGQPGGVDVGWDKIVNALVDEGEEAVEPLIRCLEEDTRLTRSVGFHRDFFRGRSVVGVDRAAHRALERILKTSHFGNAATDDDGARKKLSETIREYWSKYKGVSLAERWYSVLANDTLSRQNWLEVARALTRRADVGDRGPGRLAPLQGEPLRGKKDPTVSELLFRRIDAIRESGRPGSEVLWAHRDAGELADYLAIWDLPASIPALKSLMQSCRQNMQGVQEGNRYLLGAVIARCASLRHQAGDDQALDEYADWLRTAYSKENRDSWEDTLRPMWQNPDHPALVAAAKAMFNDPKSPWTEGFLRTYATGNLISTPLMGVAAVQDRILVELADKRNAGKLKIEPTHGATLYLTAGHNRGFTYSAIDDPLAPPLPAEVPIRVCDYYAWQLAKLNIGAPRCELYWPEAARDEGVAACAAYLKKYGARLKHGLAQKTREDAFGRDVAQLSFPPLKRLASADDVKRTTAIFSLDGDPSARLVSLPEYPMKARWTTLKEVPYYVSYYNTLTRESGWRKEFHQDGFVWQAEEIEKDGAWRRYYGFVGSYKIAKVPAEEIEFPEVSYLWSSLTNGIDCRLRLLGNVPADAKTPKQILEMGYPMSVKAQFRNRLGIDQKLTESLARKEPKSGFALHSGIEPRAWYASAKATGDRAIAEGDWQELTPRSVARFVSPRGLIPPGTEFAEFTFDVNALFDITRPGHYRLRLRFIEEGAGFAAGESYDVSFSLDKK
jgi:hypothetical protein